MPTSPCRVLVAGMRMPDPVPTFTELVTRIRDDHPDFAYIHIPEPIPAPKSTSDTASRGAESNQFLRDIWGDRAYITNSGYNHDTAIEVVEREGGLVSFARHFISNVRGQVVSVCQKAVLIRSLF